MNRSLQEEQESIKQFEKDIKQLLVIMEGIDNINDTKDIFKKLEDIQIKLACLVFKYNVKVSPFIRQFIYDFDRIDDIEMRKIIYTKVKKGEYR